MSELGVRVAEDVDVATAARAARFARGALEPRRPAGGRDGAAGSAP